jgi:iron complex outermembrane recepter protein
MKFGNFRRSVLGTVAFGALSITGLAYGQTEPEETAPAATESTTDTDEAPTATPAPTRSSEDEARQDKIVVTGSLLRRDEFTSSAPIQVITAEVASLEGLIDTADILQGSSIAAGSTQINNQFGGFVVNGGPGVNTVSLRGLGAQRTLLLFNGRRLGPSGVEGRVGAVDLNTIPQSVVQRVEILKDGAGSIYGSDAVAGVINIITSREIEKPVINVSGSAPFEGGGEAWTVDGAFGLNFDEGFLTFSAYYSKLEPLRREDRDYYSCAEDYVFDPNSGARIDRIERNPLSQRQGEFKCFNIGVVNSIDVNTAGGVRRFAIDPAATNTRNAGNLFNGFRLVGINGLPNLPTGQPFGTEETDTDDPRQLAQDIIPEVERYSAYVTGEYNLGGFADVYGELLYNHRETSQKRFRQFFPFSRPGNLSLGAGTNAFVNFNSLPSTCSTTVGGAATASCGGTFNFVRPIALIPFNTDVSVDYWYGVAGLRGELGDSGWNWDVHASHSISDGDYTRDTVDVRNVVDAQDVRTNLVHVIDPGTGQVVCRRLVGGVATVDPSCVAVNYFSRNFLNGALTQAERDFLFDTDTGNTEFTQTLVNAVVAGELFELPAGKIGLAVGAEYRKSEIDDQPGPLSFGNNQWGLTSAVNTQGTDELYEFFGEVEIPLVKGVTLFDDLSFNASYRWFDYEQYDADSVYKIGLNWQIAPQLRLRATQGSSYRAPGLFELFLGNQTSFAGQLAVDPCINWGTSTNASIQANCAADGIPNNYGGVGSSALVISGGGAGILTPETSEATTIGAIISPTSFDLSVALDYFEIEVEDQVAQLGSGQILGGCYGGTVFPNAFCDLFTRDTNPASPSFLNILTVNNNFININNQRTRGLDLTTRYEHEFSFGELTWDFTSTWTFEDAVDLFQGVAGFATNDFNGTLGQPDFVANTEIQFERGDWTFFWGSDFTSRSSNDQLFLAGSGGNFRGTNGVVPAYFKNFNEPYIVHNASVRYRSDDWQVILGVSNLFDEHPPFISTGADNRLGLASLNASQVDLRGRAVFGRVSKEF